MAPDAWIPNSIVWQAFFRWGMTQEDVVVREYCPPVLSSNQLQQLEVR